MSKLIKFLRNIGALDQANEVNNNKIIHLDLTMNQIGTNGILSLFDLFKTNSTLTKLNLSSNHINNANLKLISEIKKSLISSA